MNFSNTHRKVVAFILTLALIITGVFPTVVFPTGVAFGAESDISDHWAQTAIQEALANGYISGYPDGSFRPDDPVTRAEFVTMVNGALGLKEENKVNLLFTDVDKSVWYYDEVQKASYAQYISGTSDTTFAPEALITRQEAAAMLSRFLPGMEETNLSILSSFSDSVKLSNWAITPMAFMIEKGYKTGYQDKTLRPLGSLTRAEAVQIINQILHKETIVREDTSVKEAGAILANAIYVGDITIESSVGSGDVGFADLSALSKVYVYGGGSNTVTIDNSLIIEMIVGKIGSAVRVLVNDDSDIKRSLVLGSNLLVNERGEVAEPRTGPYGEIVTIKGTTSQRTFLQYVDSLGERLTQSGELDLAQIHSVIGEINRKASGTQHKLGEFFIIIPQPRVTASSPSEDPVDPSPYGTVPLEAIAFCGTSHGGIGAFTTIASITINGETTTAYAIYTPAQLQHLALHPDANAILMADLDFSGVTTGAVGAADPNTPTGALSAAAIAVGGSTLTVLRITNFTGGNFTPIGTSSKPYTGTLYGNEKVITGLTISGSAVDYVGIFGYASGAAIKDLTTSGGSVSGKAYVGGIVGYSTNSTVSTVYNTGNVSGTNEFIGGIAGKSERSTVSSSHNTGTVTGRQVGGVVGWNSKSSMVSNSYNTGNVILSRDPLPAAL